MDIDQTQPSARDSREAEQLLQAVLERPELDEPRWLLADWLSQQGDPRGELIALQLGGGAPERVAALLHAHAREWLRPFEPALVEAVFERGFVTRCEAASERALDYAARAWRTVLDLQLRVSPVERSATGVPRRARGPADFEALVWPWLETLRVPCMLFQPTGESAVVPWVRWLQAKGGAGARPNRVVLLIHSYTMEGEDLSPERDATLELVAGPRVRASIRFPKPEPGAWADHPLDAYEAALEGGEVDWLGEVWGPE